MSISIAAHPAVQSAIRLFEAWVESQAAYRGLPGISLGIVYDQDLILARGIGRSDMEHRQPATAQTIYRIASISKLFTSTAIMQLRDAGHLTLEDPVAQHLPWFSIHQRHTDAPDITIRQLLTHTSGLPREAAFPYWTDGVFPTHAELITTLADQETIFAPATRWKYSNLAVTLAGEIVAQVAQQPFPEYIETHILRPLELQSTSVVLPDEHRDRLATPYGRRMPDFTRAIQPFTDCRAITPAANMSSTVEDLARFAALQFREGPAGGAQVLKGSSIREMHRVHWLNPDWQSGWGIGFVVRRREDRTLVEHGGALPGYRTQLSICPADKLAFIVLTNADDGEPGLYVEQAYKMVAPALRAAAAPESAVVEARPEWERYIGKYRSIWDDVEVIVTQQGLALLSLTMPDPLSTLLYLTPEGEHTFRLSGDNGYGCIGELLTFELAPDNTVERIRVGAVQSYPIAEQ